MWGALVKMASGLVTLTNKFIPSREEKAGKAMAERDNMKESASAKERIDAVKPSTKRGAIDRLRKGKF